jgi:trigger factor
MGMQTVGDDQPWVEEYVNKMMQDRKFIDDSYHRLRTEKVFQWAESQVQKEDKLISIDDFTKILQEHQHHHH